MAARTAQHYHRVYVFCSRQSMSCSSAKSRPSGNQPEGVGWPRIRFRSRRRGWLLMNVRSARRVCCRGRRILQFLQGFDADEVTSVDPYQVDQDLAADRLEGAFPPIAHPHRFLVPGLQDSRADFVLRGNRPFQLIRDVDLEVVVVQDVDRSLGDDFLDIRVRRIGRHEDRILDHAGNVSGRRGFDQRQGIAALPFGPAIGAVDGGTEEHEAPVIAIPMAK